MTVIVLALLFRDVSTTSSWCRVYSLKPFSMVMLKIVFRSLFKQFVNIVRSVLNLSKKQNKNPTNKPNTTCYQTLALLFFLQLVFEVEQLLACVNEQVHRFQVQSFASLKKRIDYNFYSFYFF